MWTTTIMPKIPYSIVTMLNTKSAFSYSLAQHPLLQTLKFFPKPTIVNNRRKQYMQTNCYPLVKQTYFTISLHNKHLCVIFTSSPYICFTFWNGIILITNIAKARTSQQWKHETTNVGLNCLEHSQGTYSLQASCNHPRNPSLLIQL